MPDYIHNELSRVSEHLGGEPEVVIADDWFRVDSEDRASWVVNRMLGYDEQLTRLDRQYELMRERLVNERDGFRSRWLVPLRLWAEANQPKKGKTIHLLSGSLSFRRVKRGAKVVDPKAALRWAEEHLPEAVLVTMHKKPDAEYLASYFESTGEIPDGVTILGDHEEFYVRAPKGEED